MDAIANNSTSTDNDDLTILPIFHHASQKLNQDCNVPTICFENATNIYKVDVKTSPSLPFSKFTTEIDNKLIYSKEHIEKIQSGTIEDTDKQQNTICDRFLNSKLLTSSSETTENRLKSTPILVSKQYDCLKTQTQSFENQKKNKSKNASLLTKSNEQPLNVMSEKSNGNDSQININIEKWMPKQLLLSHDDKYSVQSSNVDRRVNGNHHNINENINNCKLLEYDHLPFPIHQSFNQDKEDPSLLCRTDFDKKVELTEVAQFDVSECQVVSPVNSSKTNKNRDEMNELSPHLINGRIIATSIETQCEPLEKQSFDFSSKTKKLVPTATISIKQNLNELHFNGSQSSLTSKRNTKYKLPMNSKTKEDDSFTLNNNSSEYILKLNKLPTVVPSTSEISKSIYKFPLAIEADDDFQFGRLRSSTMISNSKNFEAMSEPVQCQQLNLSPVESIIIKPEERDKSLERKSNLNRGSRKETEGEELDRSLKRRQRHRELVSSEQSIQTTDNPSEITDVLSPLKDLQIEQIHHATDTGFTTSEFITNSFPVRKRYISNKNGRRMLDAKIKIDINFEMKPKNQSAEIHNINNDKDASLEEIFIRKPKNSSLIVEENNTNLLACSENVINFKDRICKCLEFSNLVGTQQIEQSKIGFQSGPCNKCALKRERISFDEDLNYGISSSSNANQIKTQKADKQFHHDQPSVFPILRRKSSEDQYASTNHIVSILKKKDNVDQSSSTSSNASPVTFSSSVVDTPIRNGKRQGILKKRSSLDESRYYSRSHSPDQRSILVKSIRRNSLEDIQPGILKQSSYEIKNDGFVSSNDSQPHGILKKKDSLSTPSESQQNAKHVSISQAVILAAAELCKDISNSASSPNSNNSDIEIKPILKADCPEIRTPKPILKKKSSSDFEEIRPILKTSRKSSREESDTEDQNKRPILKTESPSKHRSLSLDTNAINLSLSETSIEPKSIGSQILSSNHQDNPIISVAERIKNMELFINRYKTTNSGNMSANFRQNVGRREIIRNRFRTQPITNEEINCFQTQQVGQFKPSTSFDHLNKTAPATVEFSSDTSFAVNNLSLISSKLHLSRPLNDFSNTLISNNSDLCVSNIHELSTSMDEISAKAQNSFLLDDSCLHQSTSPTMCENLSPTQASADSKMPSTVRTTAKIFQQMDKIKVTCEDKIVSPSYTKRDTTPRLSPQRNSILQMETPKCSSTPNEVEIEPSSLSLSERLRFFSNLTDNSSANSSLTKSSYENINKSNYLSIETTPKSSSSARIKFKHVGRVSYPSFLNDSNNNMNSTIDKNQNENIPINKETKIGKIKSPFIENNVNLRLSEKLIKHTLEQHKDLNEENNSNGVGCEKEKKPRKIFTSPSISTKPIFVMNSPNHNYFEEHCKINESLDKENNFYSSIKQVRNQVPSLNKLPHMVNQTSVANEKIAKYFGILKHEKNSATRKPVEMIHSSNNGCTKNNLATKIIKDRYQRNKSIITEDEKLPHSRQCNTDDQLSNQMKRRELSKRNRAMTLIDNNSISFSNSSGYQNKKSTRAMTTDVGYHWKSNNFITKFEELKVTKEDLLLASKEFDRIFLGVV